MRTWSREMGLAVPSRVSLPTSILRLNRVLTYEIPPEFRGGVHLFILNRLVAPVAQRYHVTSDTLGCEFDPGKRDFSH